MSVFFFENKFKKFLLQKYFSIVVLLCFRKVTFLIRLTECENFYEFLVIRIIVLIPMLIFHSISSFFFQIKIRVNFFLFNSNLVPQKKETKH